MRYQTHWLLYSDISGINIAEYWHHQETVNIETIRSDHKQVFYIGLPELIFMSFLNVSRKGIYTFCLYVDVVFGMDNSLKKITATI